MATGCFKMNMLKKYSGTDPLQGIIKRASVKSFLVSTGCETFAGPASIIAEMVPVAVIQWKMLCELAETTGMSGLEELSGPQVISRLVVLNMGISRASEQLKRAGIKYIPRVIVKLARKAKATGNLKRKTVRFIPLAGSLAAGWINYIATKKLGELFIENPHNILSGISY